MRKWVLVVVVLSLDFSMLTAEGAGMTEPMREPRMRLLREDKGPAGMDVHSIAWISEFADGHTHVLQTAMSVGGTASGMNAASVAWLPASQPPAGSVVTAKANLSIDSIPGTPETFSWAVYDRNQAPVFGLGFGDVGVAWMLAPGATQGGNILYGHFSVSAARLLLPAGEGMTCSGTRQ